MKRLMAMLFILFWLAACGGDAEPEAAPAAPLASSVPTAALPTAAATPEQPVAAPLPTAALSDRDGQGTSDVESTVAAEFALTETAGVTSIGVTPATPIQTPAPPPLFGQTAEGAFYRGNPDATVTLIDYSDFL